VQYRTVSGIAQLTSSLISRAGQVSSLTTIQNISLPPHHQDQPGDRPKCKAFALVTLADQQDVESLLATWSWDKQSISHSHDTSSLDDDYAREAAKFGLRTLSKSRWDQLKEEYLSYQRKLLDELVAYNEGSLDFPQGADVDIQQQVGEYDTASQPECKQASTATTTPTSPYPLNCLVFVRNVHSETNKTTLRKLFSLAFDATTSDGLDYVDFNKGMDSVRGRVVLFNLRHSR
jgi:hypothetical protein